MRMLPVIYSEIFKINKLHMFPFQSNKLLIIKFLKMQVLQLLVNKTHEKLVHKQIKEIECCIPISHSVPMANTVAKYLVSEPRFLSLTWV